MNELAFNGQTPFEQIKQLDQYGNEYWSARELQEILGYKKWENFIKIIEKAKFSCESSSYKVSDHFPDVRKMVEAGVSTKEIDDYHLSRYACYLIAQNGDPRKKQMALAQTYFAVQTRKQELRELFSDEQKRLFAREQVTVHNKNLFDTAKEVGVTNYGKFNNAGYKGLYNGETENAIHDRKGLTKSQKILDHMNAEELAANLFRITQTDAKIKRENIVGEELACTTHNAVGKEIRSTIEKLGGTMPEELPTVESIKKIQRKQLKLSKSNNKKIDNKNT